MAALRDIARDFAAEIRDGIGWTIVYRTGRSWNALTIWSDIWNGEWETDDLNEAIGILKADPDAVIVNGYYCGHFGEDMTIDEIAAKLAEALKPVINAVLSALKKLWKVSAKAIGVPPKWLHLAAHAKKARTRKKYRNRIRRYVFEALAAEGGGGP